MKLFQNKTTYQFIEERKIDLKCIIEGLSNEDVCNCDIEDLQEYYYEQAKGELIEIEFNFDNISYDIRETTMKKTNEFRAYDGKDYNDVDAYQIIYNIPYDGDTYLLYLKPSTHILTTLNVNKIIEPTDEKEGIIVFTKVYERNTIVNQEDVMEFVKKEFTSNFSNYITMIENVNRDIQEYNNSLNLVIENYLDMRFKKAEDYLKVREKLNIPLELDKDAPNIKPIRLKKVKKNKSVEFPKKKSASSVDYSISDDDYNNIKNIINLSCISMEKTARTFSKLHEEELRDVILSSLNTHYMGNATGETFNKRGKTDIHIPFDNKSAYIGECKIWAGKKLFLEAIEQLFSYMRWRDTKTSLILFNKDNKDFKKILDTIENILSEHSLCIEKPRMTNNQWQCRFKKIQDSDEIVEVNVAVYDLYMIYK